MKVMVITAGYFPVPATKGGAVEALIEYIIRENELYKKLDLNICTTYDEKAKDISNIYKHTTCSFVKVPKYIKICDSCIYWVAKNIFKKKKHMSYRYIMQRLHYINEASKIINKNDFDKVILENHPTLFMVMKKRNNSVKYKGKYYYHLHNKVSEDYGCRSIMADVKTVLGVSEYINNTFKEFMNLSLDSKKFSVLKNCVDETRFNNNYSDEELYKIRDYYKIKNEEKIVLFTGRLNEEKGIKELLMAFRKIKYKDAKLMIVGSYYFGSKMLSEYEIELKKISEEIRENIIFTGFIDYNDIPKIYAIADVVVIPSIWDDPAPLTVIEALTAGKPLITTYSGGIPEYADNKCSIILQRDEKLIENITISIDVLLSDDKLRNKLSLKSREVAKNWTLQNYYNNFVNILIDN